MIDRQSQPRRRAGILRQRAGETVLLLSRESGQYYALEGVGERVWELSDGTRPVSAILTQLCAEYEAPAETIESDVLELLEDLADEKLLELLAADGRPLVPSGKPV